MDYRNDHLNEEQRKEPPTFLYAMDMGNGKYFLEETSLGLVTVSYTHLTLPTIDRV